MVNRENPYMMSLQSALANQESVYYPNETAQVWFRIRDYDKKLEWDKRFLHIYAVQRERSMQNGKYTKNDTRVELKNCTIDTLDDPDHVATFKEVNIEHALCLDPKMRLQGSKSYQTALKSHVYYWVMVNICSEKTRIAGDPECASPTEIDEYLKDKYFYFTGLESVVDFQNFGE